MLTEEKLLEIKKLSEKILDTEISRFGIGQLKSGSKMNEELLERLTIPSLPEEKLRRILEGLAREELCEIQALMWLGRDTVENCDTATDRETYEGLYREAVETSNKHDVDYIMGKSEVLAQYLIRGMIVIGVFENGRTAEL